MNSNDDKQLESAIGRELKALPELAAPASLANRVLAAIEHRANVPWYRRAVGDVAGRPADASLAAMLALFGGLSCAGWELSHAQTVSQAAHRVGQWLSGFSAIGNLLNILASSVVLVVKKLGTTFIIACLVAGGLGYAVFMGLGTVYFRLAFAKR